MLGAFVLLAAVTDSCEAAAPLRPRILALRGGGNDELVVSTHHRGSKLLIAQGPGKGFKLPKLDKIVDTVLAGAGVAGTFAIMGAIEAKFPGVKLFVPPMMASGIIFFSPATPPSPKGFISGTIGCASLSAAVLSFFTGVAGVSPVAAQGAAAGALLMWYKATACIFPPAAVLCVIMSGAANTPLSFVVRTWLAGHACLYTGALAMSYVRSQARLSLGRSSLRAMGGLSAAELQSTFKAFDLSNDGTLDASELKVALKSLGIDLSLQDCMALILSVDKDGNGVVDFGEFKSICKAKSE